MEKTKNPKAFTFSGGVIKARKRLQYHADMAVKRERTPVVKHYSEIEAPPLNVVVHGPPGVGKSTLIRSLVRHYCRQSIGEIVGPITVVSGRLRRLTFWECPSGDVKAMLDLGKVADLVLLVVDASKKRFEMDTLEFISLLKSFGFPKVIGVLTFLDTFSENRAIRHVKKDFKKRFWQEIYEGAKMFHISGLSYADRYNKTETMNLARFIAVQKAQPPKWRQNHSFVSALRVVVPDDVSLDGTTVDESRVCDVAVFGYIGGNRLRPETSLHVPGLGTFGQYHVSQIPDPCPLPKRKAPTSTGTLKPGQVHDAGAPLRSLKDGQRILFAPYCSTLSGSSVDTMTINLLRGSNRDSSAIPALQNSHSFETESEESFLRPTPLTSSYSSLRTTAHNFAETVNGNDYDPSMDPAILAARANNGALPVNREQLIANLRQHHVFSKQTLAGQAGVDGSDNGSDSESQSDSSEQYESDAADDSDGEVQAKRPKSDTPSHGKMKTDTGKTNDGSMKSTPDVGTEPEAQPTRQPDSFSARLSDSSIDVGSYVRLVFRNVPLMLLSELPCENSNGLIRPKYTRPVIAGEIESGVSQLGQGHESADTSLTCSNTVVMTVKQHRWCKRPVRSNEPIFASVGWMRFQTMPTFFTDDNGGPRNRFLKVAPRGLHCKAVISCPAVPVGTGVLLLGSLSTELPEFRVSALGTVNENSGSVRVVKKLKLVGEPKTIEKNTAFIKGMFNSDLEVTKCMGAKIQTVSGIRGQVKKAVGTSGEFRAAFEDRILLSDLIIMKVWVPVTVSTYFNPLCDAPGWPTLKSRREAKLLKASEGEAGNGREAGNGKGSRDMSSRKANSGSDKKVRPSGYGAKPERPTKVARNTVKVPSKLARSLPFKTKQKLEVAKKSEAETSSFNRAKRAMQEGESEHPPGATVVQSGCGPILVSKTSREGSLQRSLIDVAHIARNKRLQEHREKSTARKLTKARAENKVNKIRDTRKREAQRKRAAKVGRIYAAKRRKLAGGK